jgi:hypothetical protein
MAATLFNELAATYPEADRFQLRFKFAIDKPDLDFGPAKLASLARLSNSTDGSVAIR